MRQNMRTMSAAWRSASSLDILRMVARTASSPRSGRSRCICGRQLEELQAQLARHVVGFDVGEALAPGAFKSVLDGAGAREAAAWLIRADRKHATCAAFVIAGVRRESLSAPQT